MFNKRVLSQKRRIFLEIFNTKELFCKYSGIALVRSPILQEKCGLSSGGKLNTFMFRLTLISGFSRELVLSSGWPLKRRSTVLISS